MERTELLNGVDFKVGLTPATMQVNDKSVIVPNRFATYRMDTGQPMDVVGRRYKVHQHTDIIIQTAKIIDKFSTDYTVDNIFEGARITTRFSLKDKAILNGVSHEDSIIGVDLINTHDGSKMIQLAIGIWRLICTNGMKAIIQADTLKKMHSKGITLGGLFTELPSLINTYTEGYKKMYTRLNSEKILSTEIVVKEFGERLVKNARVAYQQEYAITQQHTAWTQYQSFTRVISHSKFQEKHKHELSEQVSRLFLNQFNIV